MLRLHYFPGKMSLSPHIVLNEIGVPFELVYITPDEAGTQTDEFKTINPKGKIPVLEDGPSIITESGAILYYLGSQYPEAGLLPKESLSISRIIEWECWLNFIFYMAIQTSVRPDRFTMNEENYPEITMEGQKKLLETFSQIDQKLAQNKWALDEGYSVIDSKLLLFFRWGFLAKLDMTQFKYWCCHAQAMEARPAVIKTLEVENISIWS